MNLISVRESIARFRRRADIGPALFALVAALVVGAVAIPPTESAGPAYGGSGAGVPVVDTSDLPAGFVRSEGDVASADELWRNFTCEVRYLPSRVALGRAKWIDGTRGVIVLTARATPAKSSPEEAASVVQHDLISCFGLTPGSPVEEVDGAVEYTLSGPEPDYVTHEIILRRGAWVAVVVVFEPRPASSALATRVAEAQARRMGTGPSNPARISDLMTDPMGVVGEMTGAAVIPVILWVLVLEWLDWFGQRRRARTRWRLEGLRPPKTVDVTNSAKDTHRAARALFIVGLIPVLIAVLGLAAIFTHPLGGSIAIAVGLALGIGLWLLGAGSRRRAPRYRPTLLAVIVGLIALAIALAAFWPLQQALRDTVASSVALELTGGDHSAVLNAALTLLLMGLASGVWRFALRLSRTRPSWAVQRDPRPRVLFLRSFRDDELHLRVAPFARAGLTERLSGRRYQGFEEIIAEELQQRAPVTAVSEPGRALPPLGVARETLDHGDWRAEVRGRVDAAAAVVVVLGRGEGLAWEIRLLAQTDAWRRTLIVVPPVLAEELIARWTPVETILRDLGFRRVELPPEPSWLLVLGFTSTRDCLWFTGDLLNAWSYKAAVAAALAHATQPAGGSVEPPYATTG